MSKNCEQILKTYFNLNFHQEPGSQVKSPSRSFLLIHILIFTTYTEVKFEIRVALKDWRYVLSDAWLHQKVQPNFIY